MKSYPFQEIMLFHDNTLIKFKSSKDMHQQTIVVMARTEIYRFTTVFHSESLELSVSSFK